MIRQRLYNASVRLLPKGSIKDSGVPVFSNTDTKKETRFKEEVSRLFHRHRVHGASAAFFDAKGITAQLVYGDARKGVRLHKDTFFRAASVSKMITAACAMRLHELGILSIDADVNSLLPFRIDNGRRVTPRSLMTHTAGLHDGASYNRVVGTNAPVTDLLNQDNFLAADLLWEYSNFGGGLLACVMESAANASFEIFLQQYLFKPLKIEATFYPQKISGYLADAYRVFPFTEKLLFDARQRQQRPMNGWDMRDEFHHYTLSQGNCCIAADGAARIGSALMSPGFLTAETLSDMRRAHASFGKRDPRLEQGIGTFIINDKNIAPYSLYGHQGLAYGGVHGLFFDPKQQDGVALLTSGASEARNGVLADINLDLIRLWQRRGVWK